MDQAMPSAPGHLNFGPLGARGRHGTSADCAARLRYSLFCSSVISVCLVVLFLIFYPQIPNISQRPTQPQQRSAHTLSR